MPPTELNETMLNPANPWHPSTAPGDKEPEAKDSPGRFRELDALRGIAALIVVLFHCWMTVHLSTNMLAAHLQAGDSFWADPENWFRFTPLRVITAGPASVGLFFTLSGFVLALPWARGRPQGYLEFLTRRFFRLYVPFAVAIGCAALLCQFSHPTPIASLGAWFNDSWNEPLGAQLIAAHLFMLGTRADMSLDNVMWSLVHEARISLIFPFLIVATLARPVWVLAASIALFAVLSTQGVFGWIAAELIGPGRLWGIATMLDSLRYGIYFVVGLLVALHRARLTALLAGLGGLWRGLLWLVAAALLLTRFGAYSDASWAAGAALLIVLTLAAPGARRALCQGPLLWLGRVSYSLYLVHVPIILGVVHAGYGRVPIAALLATAFALSLLLAELFNRAVEQPSQKLGQKVGSRSSRHATRTFIAKRIDPG